jgi:heme oxygenase
MTASSNTLRDHLRRATACSHERLDRSMRPASDWRSRDDYARFLSTQYAARLPVEGWLMAHAPAGLKPPEQTPLIARDLVRLGAPVPGRDGGFTLAEAGPSAVLGVAWVLAGSSLGNRAMLHDMRRALDRDTAAGTDWPQDFLGSRAMTRFWKALRQRIEARTRPAERARSASAACGVFDHFLAHAARAETPVEGDVALVP